MAPSSIYSLYRGKSEIRGENYMHYSSLYRILRLGGGPGSMGGGSFSLLK